MNIYLAIKDILGLAVEPKDLSFVQISLRGAIVFIAALLMVRMGNKRFLARMSAFDAILGFIMASMLARAVNGSSAFFPTLGAGFVLVGLHSLMARLSFRSKTIGFLVKGRSDVLVENGKTDGLRMKANKITEDDLMEEARLNGRVFELADIRRATIERSGEVSVVPAK